MDKAKVTLEVQCELDHLRRLSEQAQRLMTISDAERREWDAVAAAKYVADVWLAVENLCKRRYAALEIPVPTGPDSHTRILAELLADPTLGRGLSADFAVRLKKYLAFRHRFIHGYGQEVTWTMVEEPLRQIPDTVSTLTKVWTTWLATL
jgi:uncharacterized protein YutE (UPF0331/DUF86 family)